MRLISFLLLLPALSTLNGCVTYGRISAVAQGEQKEIFRDGRQALYSPKTHIVTVGLPVDKVQSGTRVDFALVVRNGSDRDVVFSTEDITIATQGKAETENVKVFSHEELVAEEKTRQAWMLAAAAMQGISASVNAANAGYSNTYGTYSGSAYSNTGRTAYGQGTYSATTYNPALAAMAQSAAQTESNLRIAQIAEQGRGNLATLASAILKKETIFPGGWHGGLVRVQMPPAQDEPTEFLFTVKVGGEPHIFRLIQSKASE